MKEKIMFLLPIFLVLCVGVFFSYRWWKARTNVSSLSNIPVNEGIEVGEREQSLLKKFGVKNQNSIELYPVEGAQGYGAVNWSDDKKTVTVVAALPDLNSGVYQVWITRDSKVARLGTLVKEKAGYVLDYSVKTPLTGEIKITISVEQKNDTTLEKPILEGTIVL